MKTAVLLLLSLIMTGCGDVGFNPESVPAPPSKVAADFLGGNTIQVSWKDNAKNEDGFIISRGNNEIGWIELAIIQAPNTTAFTDKLDRDTPRVKTFWRVSSFNAYGVSELTLSNEIDIARLKRIIII